MPYGYYQLVRYITAFSFGWFAYQANTSNDKNFIFYVAIAILFQPFIKVPLGRVIWSIVDVVVAGYLIYSLKEEKKT